MFSDKFLDVEHSSMDAPAPSATHIHQNSFGVESFSSGTTITTDKMATADLPSARENNTGDEDGKGNRHI